MKSINTIYSKVGFSLRITSKSAKVLGTSLAFELGMTDDQVMILGRWKNPATAQYYRSIDPSTLLKIFSTLVLNPSDLESARLANQRALRHRSPLPRSLDSLEAVNHLALPGPNQSPDTSMIPYVFPQQTATFQNQVQDSLMSDRYVSAWQFMITTGFYPAVLAPDGFPIPREVPNVIYPPQDSYPVIEDSSFVVKID